MSLKQEFTPEITADGSYTFFSTEFGEKFHSHSGAKEEALEKFVKPCRLPDLAKTVNKICILDICYGLGYNTAAALSGIWTINPQCVIELIGLELNPNVPQKAIAYQLLELWNSPIPELLNELAQNYQIKTEYLEAKLILGDGRLTIQEIINTNWQADAIFLDPFSPPKCPQLWTVEFINLVGKCLKSSGILGTYSCAASIRKALMDNGLNIGASNRVGRRSPGTIASHKHSFPSLSLQELEHLDTRAAIPYRDLTLQDTGDIIKQRRQKEQEVSLLKPTSHWKKRWF